MEDDSMRSDEYINPTWTEIEKGKPHNWMRYVSLDVRKIWMKFPPEYRVILGSCFQDIANDEEWE